MAEYEHFSRGRNKTPDEVEDQIEYYIIEYFLEREFKDKNLKVYIDYIRPTFERENYINLSMEDDPSFSSIFSYDFSPEIKMDESEVPLDLYRSNYTEYLEENYEDEIYDIYEKIESLGHFKPELFRTVEFDFLQDKYLNSLPRELYIMICSYPHAQKNIVHLNDIEYQAFLNTINKMLENFTVMDVMTHLDYLTFENHYEGISEENIDNIDYEMLINKITNNCDSNFLSWIPTKDFDVFSLYKQDTQSKILSNDRIEMFDAVFTLRYGLSYRAIKDIFQNADELLKNDNSQYASLYNEVNQILNMSNDQLLSLYNNTNETNVYNQLMCKNYVTNKNLDLFNNSLIKAEKGSNIIELEDDFHMFVHITGAFVYNDRENYYDSWNRNQTTSLWLSCSYISNEMMCTAPLNERSVCFGFNEMDNNSLLFYGVKDLESEVNSYDQNPMASVNNNILPDEMIDYTGSHMEFGYYNELDFARIQDGQKKNPDYIVMFKNNGEYINEAQSLKAQSDFGDLPIVVVDIDKMLKKSEERFNALLDEYRKTNNIELVKEMYFLANNCHKTCFNWKKQNNYFMTPDIIAFLKNNKNNYEKNIHQKDGFEKYEHNYEEEYSLN